MYLDGQLLNAQLENKAGDYTAGPVGRIWWSTATSLMRVDDGTNIRSMLRNDGKAVIGSSGTASQNIRFHRGAVNLLQLVTGDDVTAEGTLSTTLNKISARIESYTDAGKPAAANSGRLIWTTDLLTLQVDSGAAWIAVASGATTTRLNAIWDFVVGSAAQVTAGTATHSSLTSAIAAASAGNTIYILEGTYSESPTVSKQLYIFGAGYGSYISGAITFSSGSVNSYLSNIRTSTSITLNSGANTNAIDNVWLDANQTFVDNGTGNLLQGMQA